MSDLLPSSLSTLIDFNDAEELVQRGCTVKSSTGMPGTCMYPVTRLPLSPLWSERLPLADNRLEYLESSRNVETGSIRFRRQSLLVSRLGHNGDRNIPRIRPRLVRSPGQEVYLEQFGGCEIRLEGAEAEARMTKIDPDLVL